MNKLNKIKEDDKPFKAAQWTIVFDQLEKFNLHYDKSRRNQIVSTQASGQILEILNTLFDIDNSPTGERQAVVAPKQGKQSVMSIAKNGSPRSLSGVKSPQ